MKIVKSLLTGLMGVMAIFAITNTVYADEMNTEQPAYINGGIGQEEADDMRLHAGEYNLRLYFSEAKQGQSISDVTVTVTDKKGNVKLEVADAGPMLFAHMENGIYKITSQHNGVIFTKTVKVVNHKGVNVHLNWKNSAADATDEI
ncbi:hypothetical protein [Methylotenera sp.]|uniref:hypothetical protein n=1 Tax=Methylotenera sp. TaxID=2051956 RepID=UPI002486DCFA|nr:hypothetical protein [Methylotenera sp.]MDI1361326.1 hypothetical protein [Methylotenera sp.]